MVARTRPDDRGVATPMVISESGDHVVIAFEVEKLTLYEHRRFFESLVAIAAGYESLMSVTQEEHRDEGSD